MSHPWLQIPIGDYEGHMAHPEVAQAEMLGAILRKSVSLFQPSSLAVLGVAGGNGLECVDARLVQRVVALDFNSEYLRLCTERHASRFTHYEPILHDLAQGAPAIEPVDLVYAGLLLEYLDCETFFTGLPALLSPQGAFVTVLQLPSPGLPEVSRSPFASLSQLESAFRFVDPATMRAALVCRGFSCCMEETIRLESGKAFHYAAFQTASRSSRNSRPSSLI